MTRLIDADALKNKFWHGDLVPNKDMYHISEIMCAIDNTPTVEYSFEKAFQKTVCEQRLYCPERPQLSDKLIEKITDLLETEWGYEGIREDVSRILREADNETN